MKRVALQLRAFLDKLKTATYAREKAGIVNEMVPVVEKAIKLMEQASLPPAIVVVSDNDHALDRLIAAVAQNKRFRPGQYHISNPAEFAEAITDLIKLRGVVETIVLRS